MKRQGDGRIVNIAGFAGKSPGASFLPGGIANAGVLNFTKGIAAELARDGIRINVVSPAGVDVERIIAEREKTADDRGISYEELEKEVTGALPLGRTILPGDVANFVVFLVSDLASAVTGTEVIIDAGIGHNV